MLNIDEDKLKILLNSNDKYIKTSYTDGLLTMASGLITIITDGLYGFDILANSIKSSILKVIIVILGGIFVLKGIYDMVQVNKHSISADTLFNDIKNMDIPKSRYSLVAIKDAFNEYPKRYLLFYDVEWKCFLFPHYKTTDNDKENIIKHLSIDLEVNPTELSIDFKAKDTHTKFSVSNNKIKTYEHNLYQVNIRNFNNNIIKDSFSIGDKRFKWFSMEEMLSDKEIFDKNYDIVKFVTENI